MGKKGQNKTSLARKKRWKRRKRKAWPSLCVEEASNKGNTDTSSMFYAFRA